MFMTTITSPPRADRDARRRSLGLATCRLSVFIAGIDVTIVNVDLPSIQGALHASVSGLQWTIDAYTLVSACLLMLLGMVSTGRWALATTERNGARLATAMSPTPEGAR
jgi:hypothetical protein